jgi:ABC-type transport system involved in cytochrome bd biosynthesis fused ATPase/permease subunit
MDLQAFVVLGVSIPGWLAWALVALVIVALVLWLIWRFTGSAVKSAVERSLSGAVAQAVSDAVPGKSELLEVNQTAKDVRAELLALKQDLKEDAKNERFRSTVQVLCGTLVGLLGGFWAQWVVEGHGIFPAGQTNRALIVAGIGVVLVGLMPPVTRKLAALLSWMSAKLGDWFRHVRASFRRVFLRKPAEL